MEGPLSLLAKLQQSLSEAATDKEVDQWWTQVQLIEASLYADIERDKSIKKQVQYLKDKVTDLYSARREGLTPNYVSARIAVGVIEGALRKNSVGEDGWPLR